MNRAEIRNAFQRDGVLIIPDFFKSEEMAEINSVVDGLLTTPSEPVRKQTAEYVRNYETDVRGLGAQAAKHPAFQAFGTHPRLKEVTEAALGGAFIDEYLLVQVTRQGTGQAWHQDSHDPVHFVLNRLIYTRDIAPEQGQVVVVPGSIHRGRIPPGGHQDSISGELAVAPRAGTLVLMSTYCWHRVTLNTVATPRFSVNYRVRPVGAPEGLTSVANFRNGVYDFKTATSTANA